MHSSQMDPRMLWDAMANGSPILLTKETLTRLVAAFHCPIDGGGGAIPLSEQADFLLTVEREYADDGTNISVARLGNTLNLYRAHAGGRFVGAQRVSKGGAMRNENPPE